MTDIKKGHIVRALAGREKGKIFIVLDEPEGEYLFIVDGRVRKLESPKKKKIKHILFVDENDTRTGLKMKSGQKVTNAEIRRLLSGYDNKKNLQTLGGI